MSTHSKSDSSTQDFQTLYRRYFHAVRAVVTRFRFQDAAADDLIQDIFIQAWRNMDKLKEQAAFSGWLMTIARNRCLNEIRKTKHFVAVSGTDSGSDEAAGERDIILVAEDDFASLQFEHSLSLLRELVAMHEEEPRASVARQFYLEERPIKEIAEALHLNQNTVLSHLRRFRLIVSQAMLRLVEEKGLEIS